MLASALAATALAVPPALSSSLAPDPTPLHRAGVDIVDPADLGRLQAGDVVFLSAPRALWARLASQWSLPKYNHGHVGMVVIDGLVRSGRSRNTPPATRIPDVVAG